jgi:cytochrome bd ubiquinol oxidase subunit I
VTGTSASSLWAMFGIVAVVCALVFGAFLAVLRKMRTRWRIADEGFPDTSAAGPPEDEIPYGPRLTTAAGSTDAAPEHGTRRADGGRATAMISDVFARVLLTSPSRVTAPGEQCV